MDKHTGKPVNHDEWWSKIKAVSDASAKPVEHSVQVEKDSKKNVEEKIKSPSKSAWIIIAIVFLIALLPRLYFLFFVADPQNAGVGWYGDTYHHWQIAYLTKEIGLSHGFLRLWDLKGMEYFWGLAHPLGLMTFMSIFGSTDIVISRLMSIVTGSLSITILFLLARRYWGLEVAIATALIGALNPVSIFNDSSGMVEPFGMLFLFAGLYFWPRKPWATGILFAIASMARAEFWLFTVGLLFALIFFIKEQTDRKLIAIITYVVVIGIYMKYLLTWTGNAVYPIWWNFLGNAAGEWQADIPLTRVQVAVQPIWIGIFVISLIGILYVLWKRPRAMLLHLLGLGSFLFLGFFVGLTEYIKSYLHYFWVVRIFSLQYLWLGLFLAMIFFVFIPKIVPFFSKLKVGWLFIIFILAVSQLAWKVIWFYYEPTQAHWRSEIENAKEVAGVYKGGAVLIHEGDPVMTYALVKYAGINGKNIQGQMYDPFQYKPFVNYSDPFKNWGKDRKIILNWLKRDNIKLLIFHNQRERYLELVKREPEIFTFVKDAGFGLKIYEVKL